MTPPEMTPELWAAYNAERDHEAALRAMYEGRVRANQGNLHGWSVESDFRSRTPAEMLAAAVSKLEARRLFAASPEGQFCAAVADIEGDIVQLLGFLEQARSARCRSWVGELPTCDAALSKVQMVAKRIANRAADAQLNVDEAARALESAPA